MICTYFCVRYHSNIHRKQLRSALTAHYTAGCGSCQKILGHNCGNFLPGLCHAFLHNPIIRTHGNHCFFLHTDIRSTCDTGNLCQHIFKFTQGMQWLCNTVPSFFCTLHGFFIQRTDLFYCLFQSHHLLPPVFLPVVKIKNLLNI